MRAVAIVLASTALIIAFCLGGAFQAATTAVPWHREGARAELYQVRFDATMRYLGCLSDHCDRQRATYQDVIAITDKRLSELGGGQ